MAKRPIKKQNLLFSSWIKFCFWGNVSHFKYFYRPVEKLPIIDIDFHATPFNLENYL